MKSSFPHQALFIIHIGPFETQVGKGLEQEKQRNSTTPLLQSYRNWIGIWLGSPLEHLRKTKEFVQHLLLSVWTRPLGSAAIPCSLSTTCSDLTATSLWIFHASLSSVGSSFQRMMPPPVHHETQQFIARGHTKPSDNWAINKDSFTLWIQLFRCNEYWLNQFHFIMINKTNSMLDD